MSVLDGGKSNDLMLSVLCSWVVVCAALLRLVQIGLLFKLDGVCQESNNVVQPTDVCCFSLLLLEHRAAIERKVE